MAAMVDVLRKITLVATATGVDEATGKLRTLAGTQGAVAVSSDIAGKASLSTEAALRKLTLSVDTEFRSEQKLEAIQRTLTAARNEGLITLARENELLALSAEKYAVAGESAKVMAEGMAVAGEVTKGLLASLGPILALTALAELPSKIIESTEAVGKISETAETIGITTKNLQELDYAASQTGVSTENLDGALEKFSKNLGIAATGTGDLYKILKANHVAISGDVTKDFENYANLVQNATNAEQRNYLTTAAFGKGAADLGRVFNEGADGIKRYADEADNLDVVLSDGTVMTARELNDEFASLEKQLNVTFEDFMVNIAPALEQTLNAITLTVRAANAAVEAAKWAGNEVAQMSLPLDQRSDAWIEADIARMQKLIAEAKATMSGDFNVGGFIAMGAGGSHIAGLQAQLDADQQQMAVRNSAFGKDTGYNQPATTTKPPTTKLPPPPPDAAAAKQASEIQKVTDSLNLQLKALTETDRQKEIDTELSKAHVTASSSEGQAITALAGKYYDEKKAIEDANQAAEFFASTTESAFEGLVTGSESVTDALGQMLKALAQAVLQAELLGSGPLAGFLGTSPTTAGAPAGILGSLFSSLIPHANGGVHASAGLSAYSGSIVSSPTIFPFASGAGLMGEAGPEAILPLKRGSDGKLGISAGNGGGGSQQIHVTVGVSSDGNGNLKPFVESITQKGIDKYDATLPEKVHHRAIKSASPRPGVINSWRG